MKIDKYLESSLGVPSFGDEFEIKRTGSTSVDCAKEGRCCRLCEGCKSATPESMNPFIGVKAHKEDDFYYCFWCEFVQATGINESIVKQQKEKERKNFNYEFEDDGSDAMWMLIDSGAFSDEGLMPDCLDNGWELDTEADDIIKELEEMEFIGNLLKTAREKINLSIEELASRLKLPEIFIKNIEEGEYINRYGVIGIENSLLVVSPTDVNNSAECIERKREWWEDYSDSEIARKVANYLSYVLNPPVDKKRHILDHFEESLIKTRFVDDAQTLLENDMMTMRVIQSAFRIGYSAAYHIEEMLYIEGRVKEFPKKDKPF